MSTFIIAEAGVNHNGDEALALQLVETAKECGADAVKFQTFDADKLVLHGAEKAEYQKRQTGGGDQHAMLKALELSREAHRRVHQRCTELGIEFMSTPFDEDAADFLLQLGMARIKVPSGEITNTPFLEFLAAKDLPMIVSTGMASLSEILEAVRTISATRHRKGFKASMKDMVTVLHCTSNYPATYSDVNLRAMATIARATGLPIGYSDHTTGIAVSAAAVALGATVIEKHFTLDRGMPGPDHAASLEPRELSAMISQVRAIEAAMGSDVKEPTASELPVRSLVRRSLTTVRDVAAGATLQMSDVALLRPGTGIPPRDRDRAVGKRARKALAAGTTLQWSDLE
jgi:N,N'-diacetyllegionaminate synthase